MARFFKFHSVAELEAACEQLGLDLRFSDDFGPLFRPVRVGPLRPATPCAFSRWKAATAPSTASRTS